MQLTFHGGAGAVTGANYLLESGVKGPASAEASEGRQGSKILIDCGLQQGGYFAERQNFEPFPYNPSEIKAVFVTHAHIDHIGRLPKLLKDGFRGTVYSTPATRDFAELLLLDSMHILEKEAEREGRPPLYLAEDIENLMRRWEGVEYHSPVNIGGFKVTFFDAGHILGSAIIRVEVNEAPAPAGGRDPDRNVGRKTIVFSGDLGNSPAPIIKPTETIASADYCLIESTYGDRLHEDFSRRQELLEDAIEDAIKAGGVLMIPAFAMERTQDLLFHIHQLLEQGRIPKIPVFIDSPLAIELTAIYRKYERYFNKDVLNAHRGSDDILSFPGLRLALSTEQSKEINDVAPPKVIIAGSGMSNGGRILHHERRYLPDERSTILFVGYQAHGSLGRRILEGAQSVAIFGEEVPVRCRVKSISGYSAHADQAQLLAWLEPMRASLKKVFVVQGEPDSSAALRQKIDETLGIDAVVPRAGERVVL